MAQKLSFRISGSMKSSDHCGFPHNRVADRHGKYKCKYDDQDIERLSLIMTLHGMGFNNSEVETYMRLTLEGDHTGSERIAMLNRRRDRTLDEIHFKEKQIAHMDYLRHEMQKSI